VSKRTTLTIEDDIAERLQQEARRTGKPFKDLVNEALRRGLAREAGGSRKPFRVRSRKLGLRPGIELDDVEGLIERLEGPDRR
jgi:hypothetical protein